MDIVDAIVLGIVEGFSEFLPISSTGHLLLAGRLLGVPPTAFTASFDIAIQLGAILAVLAWYWRAFLDAAVVKRVLVGFLPTGVIGLIFYQTLKAYLLDSTATVLWALFVGGVALIAFELWHVENQQASDDLASISYVQAFGIGICQSFALIPGVSRSAATIVGGLFFGLRRTTIVAFSFLLAVPTIAAATLFDLIQNANLLSANDARILLIGGASAFLVSLGAIRFLLEYIRTRTFISFGVYRIVLALVFFVFVLA